MRGYIRNFNISVGTKVNNYLARYNKVLDNNTVLLIDKMTDDFKAFNERTQAAIADASVVNKPPPDFFTICTHG
jgi:hypothetical protein